MADTRLRANIDAGNIATIKNLPTGVDDGDAVSVSQLNSTVQSLIINWKDAVRSASSGNVNIASPGATIDGITLVVSDRVLLKDQTAQSENGIYIFNGPSAPLVRSIDADNYEELEVAIVAVEEGATNASTFWRQTQLNGTIDVDDVIFTSFLSAVPSASRTVPGVIELATQIEVDAGTSTILAVTPETLANWGNRKLKMCVNVGNGTDTAFNVTHNFGTRDVLTEVYANGGDFDTVVTSIHRTNLNTIEVCFAQPPAVNEFRVCVLG